MGAVGLRRAHAAYGHASTHERNGPEAFLTLRASLKKVMTPFTVSVSTRPSNRVNREGPLEAELSALSKTPSMSMTPRSAVSAG
jgi:hypothetical protein